MKRDPASALAASALSHRSFYIHSGSVNWGRFVPLAVLLLTVSGALALLLHALFRWGQYYLLIAPAVCGLILAGMGILAVAYGHCRSRWIAAITGTIAGLTLYLGYYYVGMVDDLGYEAADQIQLLPDYIRWRKQTEKTEDANMPSHEQEKYRPPSTGDVVMNWLVFGAELLVVVGISVAGPLGRSRKPYCENCHRWMTRRLTHFEVSQGEKLIEAFAGGSASALGTMCAAPEFTSVPNTTLALDHCEASADGSTRDCPAYASVKLVTATPQGATFDALERAKGRMLMRGLRLDARELAEVMQRFPDLGRLSGYATPSLRNAAPPLDPGQADALADIRPVAESFRGRVLTRRTAVIATASSLGALVMMFAGLGLAAWGGTMAFPDKDSARQATPVEKTVGTGLVAVGCLGFLGVAGIFLIDPSCLSNRYLRGRVEEEFARRPTLLVRPDEPDTMFVEVVPKLNWGKMALESASDIGFLRLDRSRKEILFEGDREHYRIPVKSITYCGVEMFVEGKGTAAATKLYYVVLRANRPGGFWEAPIRQRGGLGLFKAGRRRRWAEALQSAIAELRR